MRKISAGTGLFLFLSFCALFAAPGCRLYSSYPNRLDLKAAADLSRENPAEVAVLPVVDKTGNPNVQRFLPELRRAFYRALMDRRYTPLALSYVDSVLRTLSTGPVPLLKDLRGKFGEDALLLVTVNSWNEKLLRVDRRIRAALEVHLVSSRTGREVWGGTVNLEIRVPGHGMPSPDEIPLLRREAMAILASKVLAKLPRRKMGSYPVGTLPQGK